MTTREDETACPSDEDRLQWFGDELGDILPNFGFVVNSHRTGLNDWLFGHDDILKDRFPESGARAWEKALRRDIYSAASIVCGHVGEDVESWPAGIRCNVQTCCRGRGGLRTPSHRERHALPERHAANGIADLRRAAGASRRTRAREESP